MFYHSGLLAESLAARGALQAEFLRFLPLDLVLIETLSFPRLLRAVILFLRRTGQLFSPHGLTFPPTGQGVIFRCTFYAFDQDVFRVIAIHDVQRVHERVTKTQITSELNNVTGKV